MIGYTITTHSRTVTYACTDTHMAVHRKYILLHKVMVGLGESVLKQEVFWQCHLCGDVMSLWYLCFSSEAAQRDATVMCGRRNGGECEMASTDSMLDDVSSWQHLVASLHHKA